MRPMRSWMFVPGDRTKFLEKAAASSADVVYLDLEDGVLPVAKGEARVRVAETLTHAEFGPLRYVRVNAMETPWFDDDLGAVVAPNLSGICLPKTESAGQVIELGRRLDDLERKRGVRPRSVRVVAAIESAAALVAAPAIALSDSRLIGLMFGAEDFAMDLGLGSHREGEALELLYARSALVVAASAGRLLSIDGVFPNLDDPHGLERDAIQARRLGFTSKSTFNPRQLELLNRVFSPLPGEIEHAHAVVDAFTTAQSRGEASVALGGQLIDLPIVRRAQRTLELASQLQASCPVKT